MLKREYNGKQAACFAKTPYTEKKGGGNSNPVFMNVKCMYGLQLCLMLALLSFVCKPCSSTLRRDHANKPTHLKYWAFSLRKEASRQMAIEILLYLCQFHKIPCIEDASSASILEFVSSLSFCA